MRTFPVSNRDATKAGDEGSSTSQPKSSWTDSSGTKLGWPQSSETVSPGSRWAIAFAGGHPSTTLPTMIAPARSFRRRLASSGLWSAIGRVGSILAVLLNYRLIVALLDESETSTYVVAAGLTSLATLACTGGLASAVLRRVAGSGGEARPRLSVDLMRRVGTLTAVYCVIVLTSVWIFLSYRPDYFGRPLAGYLPVLAGWILARVSLAIMTEAARGMHCYGLASMTGGHKEGPLVNFAVTIGLLVGWKIIDDPTDVFLLHVACTAVIAMIGVAMLYRTDRIAADENDAGDRQSEEPVRYRSLVSEGAKVLISQLAVMGLVEIETLWIGRYCDDREINAWGVIRRLMEVVSGPLLLINAAIPSFVAELYAAGRTDALRRLLQSTAAAATPVALLGFITLYFFGGSFLASYDPAYVEVGRVPLLILTAANVFFVAAGSAGLTLRMANHQGWATTTTVLLAGVYFVIAPAVMQRFGLMGVAVMSASLIVLRNGIATLLVRSKLGIWCTPWWHGFPKRQRSGVQPAA